MTRSHTSAPANASARAGSGRSPFVAAQVLAGPRHARTRQAVLVGMAVAALAAAGGVHAADSEAVPVSIEGKTFKVEAPVQTQVVDDSPEKRVESGTTAAGAPVTVTRLSYRKVELPADDGDDAQARVGKEMAGQATAGAGRFGDNADAADSSAEPAESAGDANVSNGKHVAVKVTRAKDAELEPFIIHAVTPHSVSMAWKSDSSVVYNISRNGQPIAQVSGGKYVDETVNPGGEYQYSIEPVNVASQAPDVPVMSGLVQIRTPEVSADSAHAAREAKEVRNGNGPTATLYKRRTFIPNDWVSTDALQNMGCTSFPWQNVRYKGDDRDWSNDFNLDPGKNRTEITLTVDWTKTPAQISRDLHISSTTRQIDGNVEVKTAQPNFRWFVTSNANQEGTYITATLDHSISNPFCLVGEIRYKENINMWNNGALFVEGWRRRAPRHEALELLEFQNGRVIRGPWRVLQLENDGFHCLVGDACFPDRYRGGNDM